MQVIHAIYENGVFRPTEPLVTPSAGEERLDAIYTLLEARFESGAEDVAARHAEHQP
jgi:predicted DNA-binding antitoxin AbrB/MazE fold protein